MPHPDSEKMPDDSKHTAPPQDDQVEPSILGDLWRSLATVRTTIWVLPILAVVTTVGAVVPQGKSPAFYTQKYGEKLGKIMTSVSFDDVYSATWFTILLGILLLNLALCVARSWRRAGNRFRGPKAEALARKLSRSCWTGSPTVTGLVESLPRTLSGIGSKVAVAEQSPTHAQILVRRWPWAAYGTIGTHIAVFLIAVGAVLGCLPWTSMNDYIQIVEGETHVDSDDVFGFDVRLDDFRMDWYEDSGRPSTYESDVVLLVGDEEVKSGTATVNSPIKHSAIQFGQSSWGLSGLKMRITGPDGETIISTLPTAMAPTQHDGRGWDLDPQQRFVRFADDQAAVFATEFVLDAFEEDGEMKGSWSTSDPRNPAIQLQGIWGLDGEDHQFDELGWVYVGEEAKFHGYTIKFDDIVYMSALSVRRDFGIPFVWSGFILVSLGMIVMFYIQPRSFLVHVTEDSGEAGVYVASHERVFADADRKLIEDAAGVKLAPGTYAADGRSE